MQQKQEGSGSREMSQRVEVWFLIYKWSDRPGGQCFGVQLKFWIAHQPGTCEVVIRVWMISNS